VLGPWILFFGRMERRRGPHLDRSLFYIYFGLGWLLLPFHRYMTERFEEGVGYKMSPDDSETGNFLFWPVILIFTGVYVPVVLVLRQIFPPKSN
jgi:hypothetical protein